MSRFWLKIEDIRVRVSRLQSVWTTGFTPSEGMMESQPKTGVFNESDREWYTREHQQLVSRNQEGINVQGHYMQVDGVAVLTNAVSTNQRTLFKTHTVLEFEGDNVHQVVILENTSGRIVAIDKQDDTVIAKDLPTSPSKYRTLDEVRTSHPEVLFYRVPREPGSDLFYFKSYLKDKQRILGFNDCGNALPPTQVKPNDLECLFSMV